VFANNEAKTWQKIKNDVSDFLNEVWSAGGLVGATSEEAYEVKIGETDGVQTKQDTRAGRIKGQIGVALQEAGEFVIFDWTEVQG